MFQIMIAIRRYSNQIRPLRSRKPKSSKLGTAQRFLDSRTVKVFAGNGGDGCVSFLSAWCNELAGCDGGDGGHGGHIIFKANHNTNNLAHLKTELRASHGEKGSNKDCNGSNGSNLFVDVPVGTIVRNHKGVIICDLSKDGVMFVAARGGSGGKGNRFFVTDVEQAPKVAEYGAEGESFCYYLELKTMAQFGLIGFPNAGKSTLLRAITRARPKVAPYPFTTLIPHIGVVQYNDYKQIAVADLPGLIEGSHQNRGLGIQFLKHVERCSVFLYLLDMSLEDSLKQLHILRTELEKYNKTFLTRPQYVIANKMDLPESTDNLKRLKEVTHLPVMAISAKYSQNLAPLLEQLRLIYDNLHSDKGVTCGDSKE